MDNLIQASAYAGPILVSTAYFALWYFHFMRIQAGTRRRLMAEFEAEGKVFDRHFGHNRQMLAADRALGNTQEQMVPFIVSLWLYAIFVSSENAAWLGSAYVFFRALYPWLLGPELVIERRKRVLFATLPNYLIIWYMLGHATVLALT